MVKEDFVANISGKKSVMSKEEIQQALIDNFISLQKVMTNLSFKFDELSTNISKLLQLFEISAKTFAERYSTQEPMPENMVDADFIKKIDMLLDQNKIISKGLMLIEEKMREKELQPGQAPQYQYYPVMQQPIMIPSMQQPQQQAPQQPAAPIVPYKKEIGARLERKQLPKQ